MDKGWVIIEDQILFISIDFYERNVMLSTNLFPVPSILTKINPSITSEYYSSRWSTTF